MPTRTGLTIWCYTPPSSTAWSSRRTEIGRLVTDLSFASASPGGYTTFSATLRLNEPQVRGLLPEFAMFSIVQVVSGANVCWIGELTDPELGMDEYGDYLRLSALGVGNALRDDPETTTYTNQTARTIVRDQLNFRTNLSPLQIFTTISSDNTYIFPDNPAGVYSPAYDNRTFEDVIGDMTAVSGDYSWGVWAHPSSNQVDGAGFRLGCVMVHQRDTSTTHYRATVAERDITAYSITPSAEWAYNEVRVDYDAGGTGTLTKYRIDSRLNQTTLGQGSAPFRYRVISRDYTGISTVTATVAQSIADNATAQYKNPSNKISLTLRSIKDANGAPFPIWEMQADKNIFVPDLATRAGNLANVVALPLAPTAGVDQFYIKNCTYTESQTDSYVQLECDNFADKLATMIARLTLAADSAARSGKVASVNQRFGAPTSGYCAIGQSNATSGQVCSAGVQFPTGLYQAPTSIGFATTGAMTNIGSPSAIRIDAIGMVVQATASASAAVLGSWVYTTSGNCIRAIRGKQLDWHCDGCGCEHKGLSINEHIRIETAFGIAPGLAALAIDCPECAAKGTPFTESWNTALTSRDAQGLRADGRPMRHAHRQEQAAFIRQLMQHKAVGLDVLP